MELSAISSGSNPFVFAVCPLDTQPTVRNILSAFSLDATAYIFPADIHISKFL